MPCNCKMLVSANILLSLVRRDTRIYSIRVFKIMKTLSCSVARNNDLKRIEETIVQLIHTNEAYVHILYTRMCLYAYADTHIGLTCTARIFWFGLSELHCSSIFGGTLRVAVHLTEFGRLPNGSRDLWEQVHSVFQPNS